MKATDLQSIETLPFNNVIQNLIKENKVMVAYNTLMKDGRIDAYQMVMIMNKKVLMEREIFSKQWHFNMLRSAEAIILLDLIKVINIKSRDI